MQQQNKHNVRNMQQQKLVCIIYIHVQQQKSQAMTCLLELDT